MFSWLALLRVRLYRQITRRTVERNWEAGLLGRHFRGNSRYVTANCRGITVERL
jgi:hypothetical protein